MHEIAVAKTKIRVNDTPAQERGHCCFKSHSLEGKKEVLQNLFLRTHAPIGSYVNQ